MSDKKTYKVGHISVDADGQWWVHWAGTYLDEGEVAFGPRKTGGYNLTQALNVVRLNLERCKDLYVDQIRALEEANNVQEMEVPKESGNETE